MKKTYEAWLELCGDCTLALVVDIEDLRNRKLITSDAKILYRIEADTFEEALAIHHFRRGREPYYPEGKATLCPNGCGCYFYPEGSGDCALCGHIC